MRFLLTFNRILVDRFSHIMIFEEYDHLHIYIYMYFIEKKLKKF